MTNRTWRFHQANGPDALRLEDLPLPEPAPDEVRVKVKAVGLNRSDLLWITAAFFQPVLPAKVGYEFCGVVDAVGSTVTAFKPGDRVTNLPTRYIGAYAHFAEYTVCPADALVHTPEHLSDAEGAGFVFTHLTQMCGLVELAQLRPGMTVLVTAASSANGTSAILVAKSIGANVIATTRTSARRSQLLELGADHVIATEEQSLSDAVAAITNGSGADIIYDCVGGALTDELVKSCAPEATWIMYGFLDPSPVSTNWPLWFTKQPTLHIYSVPQFTGLKELGLPGRPIEFARAVRGLLAMVNRGDLATPIAKTFKGIEQVPDAFRLMETNEAGGKIVVIF